VPLASGDDLQARRLAKDLGPCRGRDGRRPFCAAKQRGFISAVRPPLDALRAAGFRRDDVYEEILKAAGESRTEA
jgi:predicted nucleic acid-binding protein